MWLFFFADGFDGIHGYSSISQSALAAENGISKLGNLRQSLISQQRRLCWPGTLSPEDSLGPLPVPMSMAWPAVRPQVLLAAPAFLA